MYSLFPFLYDKNGVTIAEIAYKRYMVEILQLLVRNGATLGSNTEDRKLLHFACIHNLKGIIDELT